MDHLKEGIGLRGYGQRDPLTEYKKEAFDMFQEMMDHLKDVVLEQLFKVRIGNPELAPVSTPAPAAALQPGWREIHGTNGEAAPSEPRMLAGAKVGRNDACPCGSGKKYKKCCLLKGA
jgi:preprotein translocase subunit SecA